MATTKKETQAQAEEAISVDAPEKEKMVTIRLPLLKENNAPVFVRVNRRTWGIPRGMNVEVPECVAKILEESEAQQMAAIAYQNANEKKG